MVRVCVGGGGNKFERGRKCACVREMTASALEERTPFLFVGLVAHAFTQPKGRRGVDGWMERERER